jgi:hypothetical protein
MLTTIDLEKIIQVLESMMQYERDLAAFYELCADMWRDDQAFWEGLVSAELLHAENIQKMRRIIIEKREKFDAGRPFNLIVLNTAFAGLKENIKRITDGELSRMKILVLARDIEQSVLESHYAEVVKTGDIEYQTLMKDILSQTYEHKTAIQKKIDGMR